MCHPEGFPEGSRNYAYFTWNGFLILRFRNDKQLKKNKKIDSSLHSESLSSAFDSERSVRNLYGSPPMTTSFSIVRLRTCTPMPSVFDYVCKIPRSFLRQGDPEKESFSRDILPQRGWNLYRNAICSSANPQRGWNIFLYLLCVTLRAAPKGLGTIHTSLEMVFSSYDFEMTNSSKKTKK